MIIRPIVLFLVAAWMLLYFFVPDSFDAAKHYKEIRIPMFSGFLTIGAFLLTLKTFILIKLKEGLYDHPIYKSRIEEKRLLQATLTHYGPLRRLGAFLIYSVASALITAISQITIGFFENKLAIAFCVAAAITTVVLVTIAWWQIRANLLDWFDILEKK